MRQKTNRPPKKSVPSAVCRRCPAFFCAAVSFLRRLLLRFAVRPAFISANPCSFGRRPFRCRPLRCRCSGAAAPARSGPFQCPPLPQRLSPFFAGPLRPSQPPVRPRGKKKKVSEAAASETFAGCGCRREGRCYPSRPAVRQKRVWLLSSCCRAGRSGCPSRMRA